MTMHTTTIGDTTFIHNGDYSGEVLIRQGILGINVKCETLISFVAEIVRAQKIRELESATGNAILGIEPCD
jgi:hypothetical protein